jgi:hypothetical protein
VSLVTRGQLLDFLRAHRYAVQASVGRKTGAQASVVGIAVADNFEIVFDTLETSRKARNLVHDQRIAFVIGGGDGEERTVQYEGLAERIAAADKRVEDLYFRVFPGGRDRLAWQGILHITVRPTWLRYSDFRTNPPLIVALDDAELQVLT